jgi:TatD DNase family protein
VIDTHAHLDACAESPQALLQRARAVGVKRVITVGSGIESCEAALAVAAAEDGAFAALGIHPHQAGGEEARRLTELRSLLLHESAVAVGETGLDFYRRYAPRDAQLRLFEAQLELASELRLPVVVHSRDADEATAEALAGFGGTVVLHCFSSPGLLETALDRGYYVSFAGNLTYPKAADLRDAAAHVPASRLLVETDCPYLAPQPVRGRPNEPANVVHTAQALARARGEDAKELEAQIDASAATAFQLP